MPFVNAIRASGLRTMTRHCQRQPDHLAPTILHALNSNLDGDAEAALTRALERLKEQGTTVVLVSHRPTLVQGVDKVLLLKDGALEMFGPRAEVLKRLMAPRPAEVPTPPPAQRLEGSAA
jgi:ABC-type protease/lipase transport system fused ATPase/permease subunit